MKDQLDKAKELLAAQGAHGNWNYDGYMQGMYNGMELIVAVMEEREPVYKEAPAEWIADRPTPHNLDDTESPASDQSIDKGKNDVTE